LGMDFYSIGNRKREEGRGEDVFLWYPCPYAGL
jgi:hypothetical protein